MSNYAEMLAAIVADPRYRTNIEWGAPRPGHPEGSIRAHIADLEANLAQLRHRLSDEECWKLKLLIHTHDTFKKEATPNSPILDPRSHASLARAFLAEFCDDADLLAMVQLHDMPFSLWRRFGHRGEPDEAQLEQLIAAIDDWRVFSAFLIVDGCTPGKHRESLRWFLPLLESRVPTSFTERDLL